MRDDPEGEKWHTEARKRWVEAVERATESGGSPFDFYVSPPFPEWPSPPSVKREIFGRYLVDRDRGVMHDLAGDVSECEIDGIANGTWVHFASELPEGEACERCWED